MTSPIVTSASLPVSTQTGAPIPRCRARTNTWVPYAPDWLAMPTRPGGGYPPSRLAVKVPKKPIRSLNSPSEFGPSSRMPWRRADSTIPACRPPRPPPSPRTRRKRRWRRAPRARPARRPSRPRPRRDGDDGHVRRLRQSGHGGEGGHALDVRPVRVHRQDAALVAAGQHVGDRPAANARGIAGCADHRHRAGRDQRIRPWKPP